MKATLLLLCMLPILGFAWWDTGHMLTATIAQLRLQEINPYAFAKFKEVVESINHLVDEKSQTLIQSASWPDDIKAKQYNMHLWDPWHFIDSPYVDNGVFPQINYTETVVNAVNVLDQAHKVLQTNMDRNTAERALFARYVVHLVGDIHQPLHGAAFYNHSYPRGDAGGNFQKILLLDGTESNLHKFWDSGAYRVQNDSYSFDRPLTPSSLAELKRYARSLVQDYGYRVEQNSRNVDPVDWAIESLEVAKKKVYPLFMRTNQVTQGYSDMTYDICKQRITLAGYRLANFVVDIFDPEEKYTKHPKGNKHHGKHYRKPNRKPAENLEKLRVKTERMIYDDL